MWTRLGAFLLCALCAAAPVRAQDPVASYPSKPIRVLIGYPAGSGPDLITRWVGERLLGKWGQPFLVENRPGASGHIATDIVAKAAPDGYTLLVVPPAFATTPHLFAKLPFDPDAMVPVTVMASQANVLMVHPGRLPNVLTLQDLIDYAKANPDKLLFGSSGNGGSHHLSAELLKIAAGGLRIGHVPYKGVAVLTGFLSGDFDFAFFSLGGALPYIKAGKLRPIAVGGTTRHASLPSVPTLGETFPGMVSATWFALIAPAQTAPAQVTRINFIVVEALRHPETQKHLASIFADLIANSPADAAAFIREDKNRWGEVIRTAGVKPE